MVPYRLFSCLNRWNNTWKAKEGNMPCGELGTPSPWLAIELVCRPADIVSRINCWQKQAHTCPAASLISKTKLSSSLCVEKSATEGKASPRPSETWLLLKMP
uniref:Uncharacterized protein n=1 Tax=Arundo donax TaxID=35708 RepID=A0A0A8YNK0_ARUDO